MNYEKMTKAELIKALTTLQAANGSTHSGDAQQHLLYELEVHQIELEMQNQELRETQQKLEASRDRYANLYDFAPVGYVTLDENGCIQEINLAGAAMLGVERSRLLGMPFFTYVARSDAQKFHEHLRQCKASHEKVITQLLLASQGKSVEVQLASIVAPDPERRAIIYRATMTDITARKGAEEALQKRTEQIIRHQAVLLKLARMNNSDLLTAQTKITEEDAKTLGVERVSIWLFNEDHSEIACEDLYRSSRNAHEKGLRLQAKQYPGYFRALGENRIVAANDARRDSRTSEFTEGYLKPFEITSMMDVPIWLHGKVVGVVCHEHTGPMREWKPEEQEFAASIADLVSLTLETAEHKRAEEALRESEGRFRVLANGAPVLIWVNGLEGCEFVNRTYLEFLDVSSDMDVQQFNWAQFVHPDDRDGYVGAYLDCFARRVPFAAQCRFLHHDGKYRWIKSSGLPHFSQAGEFLGYVGSSLDVTDIKEAEEKIRELNAELEARVHERTAQLEATVRNLHNEIAQRERAEELLRLQSFIVSNMAEGVCLVRDRDEVIVYANPKFERMFGYGPGELSGKPMTVVNYEGDGESAAETAKRIIEELHKKGETVYEVHNVKKDGTPFWCRAHTVRFEHPEFGVVYVAIHQDITELKQVAEALRRNEEYYRSLIENASDVISVVNADATIRYESPSLERVLGYKPEDRVGKNAFSYIHPDDLPRLLDSFNEVIKTPGSTRSAEYRARHLDGSWRFLESFGKSLRDETGAMMIVVNSRDVTERKRAEEQIQFLYRTSHAINQAAGFHEALAIALREICALTNWEYGEAWIPSADGKRLECSPAWHGDGQRQLASFRQFSTEIKFEAGEDLPGRVWASKRVEWATDLVSQPTGIFRRAQMVRELDLKSAVGVPILADGEVLAVLLFFLTEMHAENQHLLTLFATIAGQLGAILRRKQVEQELINSREQLRKLSVYLQSAREEERTHIAREIHDELGQALTALKMDLSWLGKHLSESREPLREKTKAMTKLIDETMQAVQRISAELRPGLLDNLGLAAAIEWQAKEFRDRTGIECEVKCSPDAIVIDRDRSTTIFRIFQETLTNIARHAEASRVVISLQQDTRTLLLKVRDNGKGITPEQIFDTNSFGLIGMRERVHPWGGKAKIKGVPGKGTVIFVSLPVNDLPSGSIG